MKTNELPNGTYKPLQKLGQGGLGEVWLATDVVLDKRQVSIKFLRQDILIATGACIGCARGLFSA